MIGDICDYCVFTWQQKSVLLIFMFRMRISQVKCDIHTHTHRNIDTEANKLISMNGNLMMQRARLCFMLRPNELPIHSQRLINGLVQSRNGKMSTSLKSYFMAMYSGNCHLTRKSYMEYLSHTSYIHEPIFILLINCFFFQTRYKYIWNLHFQLELQCCIIRWLIAIK